MKRTNDALAIFRPDFVVNTAALHNLAMCREDPLRALRVNAEGAYNVALACRGIGAFCVYVSTDYVFGGEKRGLYRVPEDPPSPVETYGWTKALGEHLTREVCPESAVARIAYLYGSSRSRQKGANVVDWNLERLANGDRYGSYSDVFCSPTWARDAAWMILRIGRPGIFHAVNWGNVALYELSLAVARMAGYDPDLVDPKSCNPRDGLRPTNTALLPSDELEPRGWKLALADYLREKLGHPLLADG